MRGAAAVLFIALASCQAIPPAPVVKGQPADLEDAIRNDDADAVRRFVKDRPGVLTEVLKDWKLSFDSPLHMAADSHKRAVVKVLLELGADPNYTRPNSNKTPLTLASSSGPNETAEVLLKAGAKLDPTSAAALGKTRELRAMLDAKNEPPSVELLLSAVSARQFATAKLLLERGVNPNPRPGELGWHQHPPLHAAVWAGAWRLIPLLVAHGADPDRRDDSETPLELAVRRDECRAVAALVLCGARQTGQPMRGNGDGVVGVNAQPNDIGIVNSAVGWNPQVGGFTRDLCEPDQIVTGWQPNAGGFTSDLDVPICPNSYGISTRPRGTGVTALHHAAVGGHVECLFVMLLLGFDPNLTDCDGRTPLDLAMTCKRQEGAEVLRLFGGRTGEEEMRYAELVRARLDLPKWARVR